jgi:co-chaperonin GroES (HSP10)
MSEDTPQAFGSANAGKAKPLPNIVYQDRPASITREDKAISQLDKLPKPTGYRILIVPYTQPAATKGGILLAETTLKTEELATTIGYVAALGPDAYGDANKFPEGAWCKKGDYVMFGRYAGARIVMQGKDNDDLPLRLLNDDEILAVIDNPEDFVGVK